MNGNVSDLTVLALLETDSFAPKYSTSWHETKIVSRLSDTQKLQSTTEVHHLQPLISYFDLKSQIRLSTFPCLSMFHYS